MNATPSGFSYMAGVVLYVMIGIDKPEFISPPPGPRPPMPSIPPQPPSCPKPPFNPPHPRLPPYTPGVKFITLSTCTHMVGIIVIPLTNNNICEDGGYGSQYSTCEIGTDYPDCAVRTNARHPKKPPPSPSSPPPPSQPPPSHRVCINDCTTWSADILTNLTDDDECQDGQSGSVSSDCDAGHDCADCGDRYIQG